MSGNRYREHISGNEIEYLYSINNYCADKLDCIDGTIVIRSYLFMIEFIESIRVFAYVRQWRIYRFGCRFYYAEID